MTGSDFGMGSLAWLAIVGLAAIALMILAAPFAVWWMWTHVSVVIR
jgi:hypothetical protein